MVTAWATAFALAAPLDPGGFDLLDDRFDTPRNTIVDTDGPTIRVNGQDRYTGVVFDGIAVFTFGTMLVDERVEVVGSHPAALLTTGDMRIEAAILASADGIAGGPGGGRGGASAGGGGGDGPGGGVAGLGAGGGGFGGAGGKAEFGANGGAPYGDLVVRLEGGSGGASAISVVGIAEPNGRGGGGGGAIELGALGRLDVTATGSIRVDGDAGAGDAQDGGGGGSGGAILLRGVGGACDGLLTALGGAGGIDGGLAFAAGGGGGGGRITMLDLDRPCGTDVSGGSSQGQRGVDGVVVIDDIVVSGPETAVTGDTGDPPEAEARDPLPPTVGGNGCGCGSGRVSLGWLVVLAVLRRRR